jgi:transcriptional regulator with XRE-family HTH domain
MSGTELPECAKLAAELRLLRERSGLTLAALAEESSYSKSSWQRYLSGRALPPWLAVRALCRLADEPEARLRALWELAESAWSRRSAVTIEKAAALAKTQQPQAPQQRSAEPPAVVSSAAEPRTAAPATAEFKPPVALLDRAEGVPPVAEPGSGWRAAMPSPGLRAWCLRVAAGVVALLCVGLVLSAAHGWGTPKRQAAASPTVFQVGCIGTGCTGLDPGPTDCGVQPETLLNMQTTPLGAGLEIRYNPLCRAAWARVWNTHLGDRLSLSLPGQPTEQKTIKPGQQEAFIYTNMVALTDDRLPLTACISRGSQGASQQCYTASAP